MKIIAVVDETGFEITSMNGYTDRDVEFAKSHFSTLYPKNEVVVKEYVSPKQRQDMLLNK